MGSGYVQDEVNVGSSIFDSNSLGDFIEDWTFCRKPINRRNLQTQGIYTRRQRKIRTYIDWSAAACNNIWSGVILCVCYERVMRLVFWGERWAVAGLSFVCYYRFCCSCFVYHMCVGLCRGECATGVGFSGFCLDFSITRFPKKTLNIFDLVVTEAFVVCCVRLLYERFGVFLLLLPVFL